MTIRSTRYCFCGRSPARSSPAIIQIIRVITVAVIATLTQAREITRCEAEENDTREGEET